MSVPNPESFDPSRMEQQYELEKGLRLMPDELKVGGMYGLRLKLYRGESFIFIDHNVEITARGQGAHYCSYSGLFHNLGPQGEPVVQDSGPGLMTLDGIVIERRAEFIPYGESTSLEIVELGYFIGQISPGQAPNSSLARALELTS